jgi:hypothetical protein
MNPSITGFQRWGDFLKALLFVCGAAWAALVWGLDSRYVSQSAIQALADDLKRDRIEAQIRDVESQIAMITLAAGYADTPEWQARRQGEKAILEQKLDSLERELEGVR